MWDQESAHVVGQEGDAVGEALGVRHKPALVITAANPAVVDVEVHVAQVPPSVLGQPVSHLHEQPLTEGGGGRGSSEAWSALLFPVDT